MEIVRKVVLEQHTHVMKMHGIEGESREEMRMGRDQGIDSLGIVDLVVGIEEGLGVELDGCLAAIRASKTVGELIETICNYIESGER